MDSEGQSINCPLLFKGEKFELSKLKMTTFLEYCNVDLLYGNETGVSSLLHIENMFWLSSRGG